MLVLSVGSSREQTPLRCDNLLKRSLLNSSGYASKKRSVIYTSPDPQHIELRNDKTPLGNNQQQTCIPESKAPLHPWKKTSVSFVMAFRAGHAVCCSFKIYLILNVLLLPVVSNRNKIKINCSFVSRGENIVEAIVRNIVEAENIASRLTCLVGHLGCGKSEKQSFFKSRISRYGSYENCITFQLLKDSCLVRIMLSGDVHCNPGPDNSRCLGHDCAVLSRSKSTRGQSSNGVGHVIPVRVTSRNRIWPTKLCMTQQRNQRNLAKLTFNRSYNIFTQ